MADKPDITPELLRQLMRYEPESGKLFWLNRSGSIVPDLRERNSWNARYAGKEVGAVNGKGYLTLEILRSSQKAHRVAWAIYYGEWPNGLIDHINGDRTDNRILNLRVVTIGESAKNRGLQKNNPSGYSALIHISEPTRRTPISYAVFFLKNTTTTITIHLHSNTHPCTHNIT